MIRTYEIENGSEKYPINQDCTLEIPIVRNGYFSIQTIWDGLDATNGSVDILKTNEASRNLANAESIVAAGFNLDSPTGKDFVDTQTPVAAEYLLYRYSAGSNTQGTVKVIVKQL
jgi:hypothetical protein